MAAAFSLTPAQWQAIRKRALKRALQLTPSVDRARELADAAIVDALDPDAHPWDPNVQPDLGRSCAISSGAATATRSRATT